VINSNFLFWSFFFLLSYFYIEFLFSVFFSNLHKNTKDYIIIYTLKKTHFLFKNNILLYINNWIVFIFITYKLTNINFFLLSYIVVYFLISYFFVFFLKNNIVFINFNILIFLMISFFVNSYIYLFLYLELYSLFFYFFFLQNNIKQKIFLIQYKNMLLLYLLNNFLASILFLLGIFSIIYYIGSTNFLESNILNSLDIHYEYYILIISLFIKLSLPGYHFLKIEIYKYLNIENVIFFSVITIYINFFFINFIFSQPITFNILNNYKQFHIILILTILFFVQKLKINNFQEFIAYSGFATNNLIILNFLIKKLDNYLKM